MALTYETLPIPETPPEQKTGLLYGIFGHLGSPVFYILWLLYFGVDLFNVIVGFLVVSAIFMVFTITAEKRHPAIELPPLTWRDWVAGLAQVFWQGILAGGGFVAAGWWLTSHVPLYDTLSNSWWLIAAGVLLTDLAYYWIHRMVSHSVGKGRIKQYWRRKHAAHHSVAEMDFLRGNQSSLVDTAFSQFQPSLIIIAWVMGMDLPATLAVYGLILALQATDHTVVSFSIGPLEYIFMDSHSHKLHHCKRGNLVNHAAAFSFFDRLWGTYYEDRRMSANYLHHHRIALPIKRKTRPRKRPARAPQGQPA